MSAIAVPVAPTAMPAAAATAMSAAMVVGE
jgi:hypothetical protein